MMETRMRFAGVMLLIVILVVMELNCGSVAGRVVGHVVEKRYIPPYTSYTIVGKSHIPKFHGEAWNLKVRLIGNKICDKEIEKSLGDRIFIGDEVLVHYKLGFFSGYCHVFGISK
jgi:hypothetical protein